jgi:hypothetical protein
MNSRAIVRLEGFGKLKKKFNTDVASCVSAFPVAAQRLNRARYHVALMHASVV